MLDFWYLSYFSLTTVGSRVLNPDTYAQEIDVNQLLTLGSELLSNIQSINSNDNVPPALSAVNN